MEQQLKTDCYATRIPVGEEVTLPAGTSVYITQTLGGSVTVRTDEGLFRIAREDAFSALNDIPLDESVGGPEEFSEAAVWDALKGCFDPEIPVNIVDLGLVYDLSIEQTADQKYLIEVKMTLTAPGCGMGPVIAEDARQRIAALPAVEDVKVHIVWDPVWTPQMISEAGRQKLGIE